MKIKTPISLFVIAIIIIGIFAFSRFSNNKSSEAINALNIQEGGGELEKSSHPLSIEALKNGNYPGSEIVIEETLPPGSNYARYLTSYKSEGLKIYTLLTVPTIEKPKNGFPVIIFNHGFIPPLEYRTTERYIEYTDVFSRNGYILFRPDYRGHGDSEGQAAGGYGSNAYTIDVLNAVASIKKYVGADSNRIGMWGHSMGGYITLRNMVVSKDVKAGVIWAGVVASYPDLITSWRKRFISPPPQIRSSWRQTLIERYGSPAENPTFWNSISANSYLANISGPVQLHHGTADLSVPVAFSQKLSEQLKAEKKEVELFIYEGDDHNLANNLYTALQRSVEFFDKYLKKE